MSYRVLPAAACLSVIREVVTDPLVDLAEGHPFARRAVDGERYEAGVAVRRFSIPVLSSFLLVQRRRRVQMGDFLARPVSVMMSVVMVSVVMVPVVMVSRVGFLDGRPHAELGEPVHGGQAAFQLRGHGARRPKMKVKGEAA